MEVLTSMTIYKAFDGKIFQSEKECNEYEIKRKELFYKLKFFEIHHSPDKDGRLTRVTLLAVYSNNGLHHEITLKYCIEKFGLLRPLRESFQACFFLYPIGPKTFSKGQINTEFYREPVNKILLSPKSLEGFSDIPRFNYMKEWGYE